MKAIVKKGNPVEFEDILVLPAQERLVDDPTVEPKFEFFEIYHIVGDPTLELWRESPNRMAMEAFTLGRYLHIKMDRVPKDAVLSVYAGPRLIRRLHPASNYVRLALPWEVMEPAGVPIARTMLRVCFWAPGYRFREIEPEVHRLAVPIVGTPELLAEKKKAGEEVVKGKKVTV